MKKVLLITFATVLSSIVFGQQLDSVKHTIDKDGNTYETRYYSPMVKINNKTKAQTNNKAQIIIIHQMVVIFYLIILVYQKQLQILAR